MYNMSYNTCVSNSHAPQYIVTERMDGKRMRAEYQMALCRGGDINKVCAELKRQAEINYHNILASIDADRLGAELIQRALSCPGNTEAHKMAHAYLQDFRRAHEPQLKELDRLIIKLQDKLDDEDKRDAALELDNLDVLDVPKEDTTRKDGVNGDCTEEHARNEQ